MTNHVHLLMTPNTTGRIARAKQSLGRRYVRYVNDRHHRSGTLREGRYKSCLVESASHLLRCYRYIELNPVRAAMVTTPADYPWSSFHVNAMDRHDPLVHPHAGYLALSPDPTLRRTTYQALVMETVDEAELDEIRHQLHRQLACGTNRFRKAIEAQLGRRPGPAKIGRPCKAERN